MRNWTVRLTYNTLLGRLFIELVVAAKEQGHAENYAFFELEKRRQYQELMQLNERGHVHKYVVLECRPLKRTKVKEGTVKFVGAQVVPSPVA